MTIVGTIIKKHKRDEPLKVELIIEDMQGVVYSLQVRPKQLHKLVAIDTGVRVQVTCKNEISKPNDSYSCSINNFILQDIKAI